MISFDSQGNLTPYTLVPLKLTEFDKFFVTDFPKSTTRSILYQHFTQYISDLRKLLNQSNQRWLGGSFISSKLDPNDIDCVNLILFNEYQEQAIDSLIPFLLIGGSRDTYQVDSHLIAVYPQTDERYELITVPSIAYWRSFLMKDKQDNPRGIVDLIDTEQNARSPSP